MSRELIVVSILHFFFWGGGGGGGGLLLYPWELRDCLMWRNHVFVIYLGLFNALEIFEFFVLKMQSSTSIFPHSNI